MKVFLYVFIRTSSVAKIICFSLRLCGEKLINLNLLLSVSICGKETLCVLVPWWQNN